MEKSDKLVNPDYNLSEKLDEYYTDIYSPGETKEQLRLGREVRGSAGGNIYTTFIQQSISATTTITITPGFTPTIIQFEAFETGEPGSESNTLYTNSTGYSNGVFKYWSFNGTYQIQGIGDINSTTSCIRLDQYNSSNNIRARVENITATSFDLNFYEVDYSGNVTVIIKCFG